MLIKPRGKETYDETKVERKKWMVVADPAGTDSVLSYTSSGERKYGFDDGNVEAEKTEEEEESEEVEEDEDK